MKFVTNMEPSKPHIHVKNDLAKANELNDFYLRFETQGFSEFIVDSFVYDVVTRLYGDELPKCSYCSVSCVQRHLKVLMGFLPAF